MPPIPLEAMFLACNELLQGASSRLAIKHKYRRAVQQQNAFLHGIAYCTKHSVVLHDAGETDNKLLFGHTLVHGQYVTASSRIGKTYLVREFFKNQEVVFFNVTGAKNASLREQLAHFIQQIGTVFYAGAELKEDKTWDAVFEKLTKAFTLVSGQKIVLFLDELPWMVKKNSRLLQTLDYYWNQNWSNNKNIKLIICGSSASWIIQKIINNKGGLHNRITEKIALDPFSLKDTEQFLIQSGIKLNRSQILLIYMAIGGIPYYLSKIKKGLSAAQIIESLAFTKKSFLLTEFDNLFSALFDDGDLYGQIVKIIGQYREGVSQRKLLSLLGKPMSGGGGVKKLRELEEAGFISSFKPLYRQKKGIYLRLIDEYLIFYLKWIEPVRGVLQRHNLEAGNWRAIQNTPEWHSWTGYAFETVCYRHISAIRQALNIPPTAIAGSWRFAPKKNSPQRGVQIDLIFDRKDNVITLCEIKYSADPYVLTKEYFSILNQRIVAFQEQTHTQKQIFTAMITAFGIKNNYYADELITGVVVLDDLFN
jgi:uncharacterized protein